MVNPEKYFAKWEKILIFRNYPHASHNNSGDILQYYFADYD